MSARAESVPVAPASGSTTGAPAGDPRSALGASVAVSGLRCTAMYVVLPLLAPVLGILAPVAGPLVAMLSVLGLVLSVRAVRAGYRADRWLPTGIAVVLVLFNLASLSTALGRL